MREQHRDGVTDEVADHIDRRRRPLRMNECAQVLHLPLSDNASNTMSWYQP